MNTTKATLAGHWERHQPGANQINIAHHSSQNSIPITITNLPTSDGYTTGSQSPRDQRPDTMAAPVIIMAAPFC
jgi:hypothetical protein